jgi:hypothetical protein
MDLRAQCGDNDSLFVKRDHASKEDYQNLANGMSQLLGLPVSLESPRGYFRLAHFDPFFEQPDCY